MKIDLNCDLGEGAGNDALLMPLITSANIACGAHAGDEFTMRAAVALVYQYGVAIGAHPGFADRENFGRIEVVMNPHDIARLVRDQIELLRTMTAIAHVKPHGALYNMAARDDRIAAAVVSGIQRVDDSLLLIGLAGSAMLRAAEKCGLPCASEVFADRTYQADGSLTPRTRHDALIADEAYAVRQVLEMVKHQRVQTTDGTWIGVKADTVCLHGDGSHAVAFAQKLRAALAAEGVAVQPLTVPHP